MKIIRQFKIDKHKPSGKWYDTLVKDIEVTTVGENGVYMSDVSDWIQKEFSNYESWLFRTTHEEGYPIIVKIK